MSKAGYTDQNRLDLQWVPSDAEMIDWITQRELAVMPDCRLKDGSDGWTVKRSAWHVAHKGEGSTWRAAVEDAMRKEVSQ